MNDRTVVNDIIKDIRAFCVQYGRDGIAGSIVERSTKKRAFCRLADASSGLNLKRDIRAPLIAIHGREI
jgi:hypothetical protein